MCLHCLAGFDVTARRGGQAKQATRIAASRLNKSPRWLDGTLTEGDADVERSQIQREVLRERIGCYLSHDLSYIYLKSRV